MSLDLFHPAVRSWFAARFPGGPTVPQIRGWPAIRSGRHTLIAAPTGSGKTLAAFLCAIDDLVRQALTAGLVDETRVVYVSPLKALSNDVRRNLEEPLAGIRQELLRMLAGAVEIRTAVRTGDTSPSDRQAMLRRPPHILVTTPESLFILLTTERGREVLQTTRTVIVDEIHAVADDKRGSHLAVTLERLDHLVVHGTAGDAGTNGRPHAARPEPEPGLFGPAVAPSGLDVAKASGNGSAAGSDGLARSGRHAGVPPVRIGLSATQRPIEEVARYLVGTPPPDPGPASGLGPPAAPTANGSPGNGKASAVPDCVIVDEGHVREIDLRVEIPSSPLSALMSNEVWEEIYDRLAELVLENRTTLIFVNTRRLAERTAHHLSKRLGEDLVTSHHGSLSRERRLEAEERLKAGRLRALVATASLELGIDIGSVDLVCQIGSPHTIAALIQRVGRSGRKMGAVARGRMFALSRDELIECAALLLSVKEGMLDRLLVPERPLDILAQQIVAAAATGDWEEGELYELVRGAHPYRGLSRADFDAVVRMLAEGYATKRGRRAAWIHHDAVNGRIRGRRGARLAVVSSGGAIPDTADFQVVLAPEGTSIGTLNEDFAIESMAGDIFQLGNSSWRILRVESGRVLVEDAHGQPPTIPFWLGEAPARTLELSEAVSRVRAEVDRGLVEAGPGTAARWLQEAVGLESGAALQIEEYLAATKKVLTVIPTQETLVLERFFDEAGGMQLVVHSPFGGRVNRAWGLALRKRFCRSFNFELQAAANEDAIVLSLGPQHSFPLIDVFHYLHTATARDLLVQALLAAPMFKTRWRWNAGRALGVLRQQGGQKVPPQLQRMRSEDLLAAAFPQAAACLEHIVGDIEVPDHPIVRQTVEDCLVEAMDIEALEALLGRIERGELRLVARDVPEPSPLAHEILNARPYAFLDDAPAEERRTLAVATRRNLEYRTADDLGTLDAAAIERVRREAWPDCESADEVHDALSGLGFVTEREALSWTAWLPSLEAERRATCVHASRGEGKTLAFWVAAERLPQFGALYDTLHLQASIQAPERERARSWERDAALVDVLRGRIEGLGPVLAEDLAGSLGIPTREVDAALIALESEGVILRGHFTPGLVASANPLPGGNGGSGDPAANGDMSAAATAAPLEWCHRRLLARIHRYTIDRLRSEIEPATGADFMRFLFAWQHAQPESRLEGSRGLLEVLGQLQGYEAPAVAWERDILPARVRGYEPAWLDELCLSGEIAWCRLVPPAPAVTTDGRGRPRSGPVRHSPVAFFLRREAHDWMALAPVPQANGEGLSAAGWAVLRCLKWRGASFVQDLVSRTGLPLAEVERGLGELVAWGLVTSDAFSGLRALLSARGVISRRGRHRGRRPSRRVSAQAAGRWSLVRETKEPLESPSDVLDARPTGTAGVSAESTDVFSASTTVTASQKAAEVERLREESVERLARQLLARYGIVVRRVLDREPVLPPWRELLRALRRLEMRGEIRGGRFLQGAAGEQFALPEAVELLRSIRRRDAGPDVLTLSGGDPLNLTGVVTPGTRIPAAPFNRIAYRAGIPLAAKEGRELRMLRELNDPDEVATLQAALRGRSPEEATAASEAATLL
jgi:ATP-dependent Lhr-like helicase